MGGPKKTREWEADTLVPVYSTGKAIAALILARLVDRGLLSYDAPVADYWPEFAAGGKSSVTVAQAVSHQAGLPGLAEEMDPGDWFDAALIEDRLARQAPLWPLGTGSGYHPVTFGFIADALARRTDGRSIGAILREEVCGPARSTFMSACRKASMGGPPSTPCLARSRTLASGPSRASWPS